jgi:hypothetical protein
MAAAASAAAAAVGQGKSWSMALLRQYITSSMIMQQGWSVGVRRQGRRSVSLHDLVMWLKVAHPFAVCERYRVQDRRPVDLHVAQPKCQVVGSTPTSDECGYQYNTLQIGGLEALVLALPAGQPSTHGRFSALAAQLFNCTIPSYRTIVLYQVVTVIPPLPSPGGPNINLTNLDHDPVLLCLLPPPPTP